MTLWELADLVMKNAEARPSNVERLQKLTTLADALKAAALKFDKPEEKR